MKCKVKANDEGIKIFGVVTMGVCVLDLVGPGKNRLLLCFNIFFFKFPSLD